jgi:protein ImuB
MHSLLLPAPVNALRLQAHEFTSPAIAQGDLFGSDAQPLQQLQRLLDRLRARLGESSIHGLRLHADYRPEYGWRSAAPEILASSSSSASLETLAPARPIAARPTAARPTAARPYWLLPEPMRIEPPAQLLCGPERIESGWWDQGDVRRDYYLARTGEGTQIWVFHDRRGGQWYLQGLWA